MNTPAHDALLEQITDRVLQAEPGALQAPVTEALNAGVPAGAILDALTRAMDIAGEQWQRLEIFLPEVVQIADVMKEGIKILKPHLQAEGKGGGLGKIVLGTVQGDIHDIGRNLVASMLEVNGFEVLDLGHDVPPDALVKAAQDSDADIIALSALMTTSMPFQEDVLALLTEKGARTRFKVIVGGGPVTPEWAQEIRADGYGRTALDGAKVARRLMVGDLGPDGFVLEGGLS
jgi:corrinoid protein of di/trimethylamine methyltransferase